MMSKLQREHDAQAAMLAFRTGLSTSMCEAWIEAPIAKSAEAFKAALLPASDDNCVIVARSEIEAYPLARVKKHSQIPPKRNSAVPLCGDGVVRAMCQDW
jgi:hypothetical protein